MNLRAALAAVLIIAAALAFRLPELSLRPFHNDEAVNAIKATDLWQTGRYRYDPDEYHGPTLHYATLPFLWLSPARNANDLSDSTLRLVPLAFGLGLILLLPLFANAFERRALLWAGLFLAISPAMVFYSRYFIHEMLLVFFSALTLAAGWRYTQTRSAHWAAWTGAGVGLMFATKETFVITLAAMAFAAALTAWRFHSFPRMNWRHAALATGVAFTVWLIFFSSFFTNFPGLLDSIRTYFPWLKRAGGASPHLHPWYFYFQRLGWFHAAKDPVFSEGLILALAVIGAANSFRRKDSPFTFFLAAYTLILTAAYSAISYKTPWCFLGFYFGIILLAGIGAVRLLDLCRWPATKCAALTALLILTGQLAFQSWRANFLLAADWRNPYVYAQTSADLLNLVKRAEDVARVSPDGFNTIVKVIAPGGDYWPLPWYLRRFKNVGWYDKLPDDPYAPIIIVAADLDARLDDQSSKKWVMVGLTELRPKKFLETYVELDLWKKFVANRLAPK